MRDLFLTVIYLLVVLALLSWASDKGVTVVIDGVPHHYQLITK